MSERELDELEEISEQASYRVNNREGMRGRKIGTLRGNAKKKDVFHGLKRTKRKSVTLPKTTPEQTK